MQQLSEMNSGYHIHHLVANTIAHFFFNYIKYANTLGLFN